MQDLELWDWLFLKRQQNLRGENTLVKMYKFVFLLEEYTITNHLGSVLQLNMFLEILQIHFCNRKR